MYFEKLTKLSNCTNSYGTKDIDRFVINSSSIISIDKLEDKNGLYYIEINCLSGIIYVIKNIDCNYVNGFYQYICNFWDSLDKMVSDKLNQNYEVAIKTQNYEFIKEIK